MFYTLSYLTDIFLTPSGRIIGELAQGPSQSLRVKMEFVKRVTFIQSYLTLGRVVHLVVHFEYQLVVFCHNSQLTRLFHLGNILASVCCTIPPGHYHRRNTAYLLGLLEKPSSRNLSSTFLRKYYIILRKSHGLYRTMVAVFDY